MAYGIWQKVGFQPLDFNLRTGDTTSDVVIEERVNSTPRVPLPLPTSEEKKKHNGLSIKNFPKDTSKDEIVSFLLKKGLSKRLSEKVSLGSHGNVEIENIPTFIMQKLEKNSSVNQFTAGLSEILHLRNLIPIKVMMMKLEK